MGIDFWKLYDLLSSRLRKAELEIKGLSRDSTSIDVDQHDKTALRVLGRPLYQFTVMSFGLCNDVTSTM